MGIWYKERHPSAICSMNGKLPPIKKVAYSSNTIIRKQRVIKINKKTKTQKTNHIQNSTSQNFSAPFLENNSGSVPEGKIPDFLTGKFVNDTPEEYVRQNIEKALVRQYKYEIQDCCPEFRIKVGSSTKRVDIVVFMKTAEQKQENAFIIVETKRSGFNPHSRKDGISQLQSYMAACVNAGIWSMD